MFGNGCRHTPDGTCTGDQHIFSQDVKGKRRVGGVSQRVKTRQDIQRNIFITIPDICNRDGNILGKCTRPVDADSPGVIAEMPPTCQTVPAVSSDQMAFAGNQVSRLKISYMGPNLFNGSYKFMTDMHGNGDGLLGPLIPVVNMDIGATDCCS